MLQINNNKNNKKMANLTLKNLTLKNHIYYNSKSTKTVCVTTCLNFFNIPIDSYKYTSSLKNKEAYKNVLRRNGYSVRSRNTEFKVKKGGITLTQLKRNIKLSHYTEKDLFIVYVFQSKTAHLIVLNGNGNTIIDTAPKCRWKVLKVSIVFRE